MSHSPASSSPASPSSSVEPSRLEIGGAGWLRSVAPRPFRAALCGLGLGQCRSSYVGLWQLMHVTPRIHQVQSVCTVRRCAAWRCVCHTCVHGLCSWVMRPAGDACLTTGRLPGIASARVERRRRGVPIQIHERASTPVPICSRTYLIRVGSSCRDGLKLVDLSKRHPGDRDHQHNNSNKKTASF